MAFMLSPEKKKWFNNLKINKENMILSVLVLQMMYII